MSPKTTGEKGTKRTRGEASVATIRDKLVTTLGELYSDVQEVTIDQLLVGESPLERMCLLSVAIASEVRDVLNEYPRIPRPPFQAVRVGPGKGYHKWTFEGHGLPASAVTKIACLEKCRSYGCAAYLKCDADTLLFIPSHRIVETPAPRSLEYGRGSYVNIPTNITDHPAVEALDGMVEMVKAGGSALERINLVRKFLNVLNYDGSKVGAEAIATKFDSLQNVEEVFESLPQTKIPVVRAFLTSVASFHMGKLPLSDAIDRLVLMKSTDSIQSAILTHPEFRFPFVPKSSKSLIDQDGNSLPEQPPKLSQLKDEDDILMRASPPSYGDFRSVLSVDKMPVISATSISRRFKKKGGVLGSETVETIVQKVEPFRKLIRRLTTNEAPKVIGSEEGEIGQEHSNDVVVDESLEL